MLKYLYSNKLLILILILIPFVLSWTYGHTLHSEGNLGNDYKEAAGLSRRYNSGHGFLNPENSSVRAHFYEDHFNVSSIKPSLKSLKQMRFFGSFFDSIRRTSKISIIFGGIIALITGGKMINDKSIIYLMVNKKNRSKSFLEFFLFPLPFLGLVTIIASLSITTISLNSFIDVSPANIFSFVVFTLILSSIEGYVLANFFVLIIRNNTLSLLSLFGMVFILPIFPRGELFMLPFSYIAERIIYEVSLPDSNYILLGCLFLFLIPMLSFLIYKRGDFYK